MDNNLPSGKIIIYTTSDGSVSIDTKLESDTIWLTQDMIVKLFESSKANISEHISNIFKDGELLKDSTVRKFRTVRKEGKRTVSRELEYYNLDMVIAVGYRVNSKIATKFRIWATNTLKEYLTNGYIINEKLLISQQQKIQTLQSSINILSRSLQNQIETVDEAKNIAKILPITRRELVAIQTARQTSQLHKIPLVNASRKLKVTFP